LRSINRLAAYDFDQRAMDFSLRKAARAVKLDFALPAPIAGMGIRHLPVGRGKRRAFGIDVFYLRRLTACM
jgi:hypothetical protein